MRMVCINLKIMDFASNGIWLQISCKYWNLKVKYNFEWSEECESNGIWQEQ